MAKVNFKRVATIDDVDLIDVEDGNIIVTSDGNIYVDFGDTRTAVGSSLPSELTKLLNILSIDDEGNLKITATGVQINDYDVVVTDKTTS